MNIKYIMMSVGRLPFYVDPTHHLHVNKITRGVHLHVTPNSKYSIPKYSRAIAMMDRCP